MPRAVTPIDPRDHRKVKKYLTDLTRSVRQYLTALDKVMAERESVERGRKIARLAGALELANDHARYFGLGVDWRKDKK
jgi:phosphate uptake regulator